MEYQHMNLENINSPEYETVIGDDYETPVEKNPQPGDKNTHVIVNLPIDKANEKKNRLPMILRILLAVVIVQVAIIVFVAVLSWKLFSNQHDMSKYTGSISFSAKLTQKEQSGVLKFVPFFSVGGGFDNKTHVFTAPTSGTYFFALNILSESERDLWGNLMQNDEEKCSAYAQAGQHITGTCEVILNVNRGDNIKVIAGPDGDYKHRHCFFSGFLINSG